MDFGVRQAVGKILVEPAPITAVRRGPLLLLLSATVLFALGPAVLKLLTERGAELGLATTSISFCNVLFVGNLCAGLVTLPFAKPKRITRELVGLPTRIKGLLILAALVSTIYPALLFTALENTTVTNVVILSRFNGIVYVALSFLFFRDLLRVPEIVGYAVIGIGVAVLVLTNDSGSSIQKGDVLVLLATLFFALTEVISRKVLPSVSIQTYVFFRNFVSSIIFFVTALVLFGPEHFMDVVMGDLWILMVVYSVFAIVVAQILWLRATPSVPVRAVANTQMLNPVFSIFFAFVLLGEVPMSMQWIVMVVIAAGMLLPRLWPGAKTTPELRPLDIDTSLVGK
jgi:drug/metabolite transporter (DMT)-like permease